MGSEKPDPVTTMKWADQTPPCGDTTSPVHFTLISYGWAMRLVNTSSAPIASVRVILRMSGVMPGLVIIP